jgi:hypothetical protein
MTDFTTAAADPAGAADPAVHDIASRPAPITEPEPMPVTAATVVPAAQAGGVRVPRWAVALAAVAVIALVGALASVALLIRSGDGSTATGGGGATSAKEKDDPLEARVDDAELVKQFHANTFVMSDASKPEVVEMADVICRTIDSHDGDLEETIGALHEAGASPKDIGGMLGASTKYHCTEHWDAMVAWLYQQGGFDGAR